MTPTEVRLRLHDNGFHLVVVKDKKPVMDEWQKKFETNPAEIELWASMWSYANNTGIIAKFTPGLDIDILDPDAAEAIEELAREHFEEHGVILVRTGLPPKRLIPLRTDEPFSKIFSVLIAPNGDEHKIEILGDGQQWVARGVHPDTNEEYRWHGGDLETTAREELPYVRGEDVQKFHDEAVLLLVEKFNYVLKTEPDDGTAHEPGEPQAPVERIAFALAVVPNNNESWDAWNNTGMAVWRATGGSEAGFAAFDAWSKKSPKYDADTTAKKWKGYFKSKPTRIGAGTIIYRAYKASPNWWLDYQSQINPPPPEPEPEPPPPDDDAELARLARMSLVEFDRARKGAAEKFGVRTSILDRLVQAKRSELGLDTKEDGKQGRPIEFQEVEPWDQPVDGAQLLGAMVDAERGILSRYVVMSEHQRVAIALWIVQAYLIDRSMISPRLAIRSPVKGCGKTTLLDVLTRLVPRPLATANVSPSAIFRVIAAHRPTLLIDEADTLFKDGDETLRGILNAGHRQGGTVLRSVGDEHEPRAFACYAATVIALIGQLPGTLADRSVDIVLARRRPNEAITAFRLDRTESLDVLARKIARWAKDNGERIGVTDPQMPPGIYNRAADNWRPLLAIAEAVGGDEWPEKVRKAAVALVGGEVDEVSRLELLLGDIREIFSALNRDWISSAELIENLVKVTPRPWSEFGRGGKPITQNKLARLLKPLGIAPDRLEVGEDRARGYFRAHFDDAFARYLAPEGVSKCPPVREPDKSGTSHTFQSVREEKSRTDANMQETQHSSHRGHMDTLKGENGHAEPLGLSDRTVDEVVEWARAYVHQHQGEPDLQDKLAEALRERLLNKYDVRPTDLDIEAERVMERYFSKPL